MSACRDFYNKLLSRDPIDPDICEDFFESLPRSDPASADICEGCITKDEIFTAFSGMKNNKTSGNDGLTKEFYLYYFELFSDILVALHNRCYTEGVLPPSLRHSYISLLCKDPERSNDLKFWRPISLLTVDYKILSKVLVNRLQKVLGEIIHPDQTCSVPGRSILDNLHLLRPVSTLAV